MLKGHEITTETRIANGLRDFPSVPEDERYWTLADAVQELKRQGMVRLLRRDPDQAHLSEALDGFLTSVARGKTPTIGQVLAGYYTAVTNQADADWLADRITDRQHAARRAAAARLVYRKR